MGFKRLMKYSKKTLSIVETLLVSFVFLGCYSPSKSNQISNSSSEEAYSSSSSYDDKPIMTLMHPLVFTYDDYLESSVDFVPKNENDFESIDVTLKINFCKEKDGSQNRFFTHSDLVFELYFVMALDNTRYRSDYLMDEGTIVSFDFSCYRENDKLISSETSYEINNKNQIPFSASPFNEPQPLKFVNYMHDNNIDAGYNPNNHWTAAPNEINFRAFNLNFRTYINKLDDNLISSLENDHILTINFSATFKEEYDYESCKELITPEVIRDCFFGTCGLVVGVF